MKKTKATPRPRVNKAVAALAEYKAAVSTYFSRIRNRQSVEHSRTPNTVTREGKTGPATILISELTSIVRTASKLDKLVVLGINGDNLVVLLEDKVPPVPYTLY
jgi:hypothetical protein